MSSSETVGRGKGLLAIVGPGILIAATGVGAGDLATGAFTGSKLGSAVLWAVLLGAFFKFALNEGLTRWQLATGDTLIEGVAVRLGRSALYVFLVYLIVWTFLVAAALMSACGATAQAIYPVAELPATGKIVYGVLLSIVGVVLVRLGGYSLFGKVMGLCIAVMFITVVVTAASLLPPMGELFSGLLIPSIPDVGGEGLSWTIALMGGVGGTVTVLCYGYWIREAGRLSPEDLRVCRIDLSVGYIMTALFGIAMVIIGSRVTVSGGGSSLIINLADELSREMGTFAKWAFLLGGFGAVFSSLLGVWQAVPYLFSDVWSLIRGDDVGGNRVIDTTSKAYRWFLYGMATVPMLGLWVGFAKVQKFYAIFGAAFIPILALTLLLMNGRGAWVGERYRNRPITTVLLIAILLFFLGAVWRVL